MSVYIGYQFEADCCGLLSAIRRAADPKYWNGPDPSLGYMDLHEQAVYLAKHVMRRARHLGLYRDVRDEERVGAA